MKLTLVDKSSFSQQTILLVEDNEDDVFIMRRAFKKADVRNPLQVLEDGEAAISYLNGTGAYADREKFPLPVVIFLDVNMPKKSGLEVLRHIRQDERLKDLTVHILTASTRTDDIERAFHLGVNAYFIKPTQIEQLLDFIKAWQTVSQFGAYTTFRE